MGPGGGYVRRLRRGDERQGLTGLRQPMPGLRGADHAARGDHHLYFEAS